MLFTAATLWFLIGFRAKPSGQPDPPSQPVLQSFGIVARNRHVWVTGLAALFFFAAIVGTSGHLPGALVQVKHVSLVSAGLLGVPLGVGGALGCSIVPMIKGYPASGSGSPR